MIGSVGRRNVPDRDGGDTPNKECVRDNVPEL